MNFFYIQDIYKILKPICGIFAIIACILNMTKLEQKNTTTLKYVIKNKLKTVGTINIV